MSKYAVLVVLDLDVRVLDSIKTSEVEKVTETIVRMHLESEKRGIKIKMLRTKLLGEAE